MHGSTVNKMYFRDRIHYKMAQTDENMLKFPFIKTQLTLSNEKEKGEKKSPKMTKPFLVFRSGRSEITINTIERY